MCARQRREPANHPNDTNRSSAIRVIRVIRGQTLQLRLLLLRAKTPQDIEVLRLRPCLPRYRRSLPAHFILPPSSFFHMEPTPQCTSTELIEAIRRRPGMYVGGIGEGRGVRHMLWEVVANAIDEHMAGRCSRIAIEIAPDGSISVEDNGRGLPLTEVNGIPFAQMALTTFHQTPTLDGHAPHEHITGWGIGLFPVYAPCRPGWNIASATKADSSPSVSNAGSPSPDSAMKAHPVPRERESSSPPIPRYFPPLSDSRPDPRASCARCPIACRS